MTKGKLSLVFGLFFVLSGLKTLKAQSNGACVGIALNEYCVSNLGSSGIPQADYYGNFGDWVELKSNFTSSVSLGGYYLSNDRLNLYKWPFPSNFVIGPGQFKSIWLSGKDVVAPNGECHTNFTIDQCKNQWLILTSAQGVVRDSVFIRKTMAGHTRGRIDCSIIGFAGWGVYTASSYNLPNTGAYFVDYSPKPTIKIEADSTSPYNPISAGNFTGVPQQFLHITLENNVPYDTSNTCFRIYYTIDNGFYPVPGTVGTTKLLDQTGIPTYKTATIIRAISVPYSSGLVGAPSGCEQEYLPSFCETNTYFTDPTLMDTANGFGASGLGVISIAVDQADTSWFNSAGASSPTVHVEYYDNQQQVTEGYTQINRPVNEQWLTKQKGFYMTIDDRRGFGCNFEGNIFNVAGLGTTNRKVFPTLHLKGGDYESHSLTNIGGFSSGTGILDVFYQSVAAKNNLHVSPLHIKPVHAFLNGNYLGVFDMREIYDKYYENYYNQQSVDSLDLMYFHNNVDGAVTYFDGPPSNLYSGASLNSSKSFANTVYSLGISPTVNSLVNYNRLFNNLDKESFIDYMILNSYAMNSNLWKYDIAFGRGDETSKPGNKWHYYLWNTPAIFNFTAISLPGAAYYTDTYISPCIIHSSLTPVTPPAGNGHGNILQNLMSSTSNGPNTGRGLFQAEYRNRYQDLLNGPLKCENILKQYDYVVSLFRNAEHYMENPANLSPFATLVGGWDTNVVIIRRGLAKRCAVMSDAFGGTFPNCYGLRGPYPLTVDVQPAGAGNVRVNTLMLDSYIWSGSYFATTLAFKAIPIDDTYSFSHWEFKNHTPINGAPLSLDSVAISFSTPGDDVVAVFTDKKKDISMPTGFSPNGDGINDVFQPLGSALFSSEFDMSVWNRWGQQVYRSTDPTKGWDGNFRGEQSQTGVYAYVISYKNIYNESKVLKGNITLVR